MYKSLKEAAVLETEILRSKFLSFCRPVKDEDDALKFIEVLRIKYKDATHVCYAYIADDMGNVIRFSDDGEPQGTAGLPILECLKNKNLKCTAIAVVRYFGGIKLGAGGLIRAYSKCAAGVIEKSGICIYEKALKIFLNCGYQQFKILEKNLNSLNAEILERVYDKDIKILCVIKKENLIKFKNSLSDIFNKDADIEILDELYYSFSE